MPERLDDPLAQRLRLPHHRLRVDGLVGRDEDEAVGAELDRDLGDGARRERVVAHRLDGVRLDQRHVLVRRGVEDDGGTVGLEDLAHLGPVLHVREHGQRGREAALVHELPLDLEQRRLRVIDEHEARRADARDLAAQLGPDRAAGAGDEHGLARQVARDRVDVHFDRLASEDVLDLDRSDLAREVEVAGDQLVQARQRLHHDALRARDVDDPLARFARRGRDRDQELVRTAVVEDVRQLVGRPEHADAVQAQVLLARVVVDQADRRVAESRACAASPSGSAGPRHRRRRRSPPCRARRSTGPADAR